MRLRSMRVGLTTCATGMRVTFCRILSTLLSCLGDRCMMTTKAMPQSFGMCSNRVSSALRPPADAPIPTTGNCRVLRTRSLFFGADGSGLVLIGSSVVAFHGEIKRQFRVR